MIKTEQMANGELSHQLTPLSRFYQKLSAYCIRRWPLIPSEYWYHITISHQYRFIWFRVAKVGTRTIFQLFKNVGVVPDAEHAIFCHYPTNLYRHYFKFAFVRNPWDRLVSAWHNKVVEENYFAFPAEELSEMRCDFSRFVEYVAMLDIKNADNHLCLQSRLIDLNNIDFLGRFENFETDLTRVAQIIGLGKTSVPQENRSHTRCDYRLYYDNKLREKVATIYHKDIAIFNYEF